MHFWAHWCEPCKVLDLVLSQLELDTPGVAALRVEAEEVPDASEHFGVTMVPFFLFLKDGKVGRPACGAAPHHHACAVPACAAPGPRSPSQASIALFPLPPQQVVDSLEGADPAALTSKFNALAASGRAAGSAAPAAPAAPTAPTAPSYVEPAAAGERRAPATAHWRPGH